MASPVHDQQAEIAPRAIFNRPEIAVLDVETADQHPVVVGQRQFLVAADQVAAAVTRMKAAVDQPLVDQRREIVVVDIGAEAVEQERHPDPRSMARRIASNTSCRNGRRGRCSRAA